MFCVYLTTYRGNKLPPFYVGSSSVVKVSTGYRGTVSSKRYRKTWLSELKLHPELFRTQIVSYFTNRREALATESRLQKKLRVVKSEMYINQSIAAPNGFWGMDAKGKNSPSFGKTRSDEQRRLMSETRLGILTGPNPKKGRPGKLNGMFGKQRTAEEKRKMSETRLKRLDEDNLKAYSRVKTAEEKQKLSEHQKIKQCGAGNARARHWVLTSPSGVVTELHGNFKVWCAEHNLPTGSKIKKDGTIMTVGRWAGWSCRRI